MSARYLDTCFPRAAQQLECHNNDDYDNDDYDDQHGMQLPPPSRLFGRVVEQKPMCHHDGRTNRTVNVTSMFL